MSVKSTILLDSFSIQETKNLFQFLIDWQCFHDNDQRGEELSEMYYSLVDDETFQGGSHQILIDLDQYYPLEIKSKIEKRADDIVTDWIEEQRSLI